MGIRLFISYRRGDDRQAAGRLRDRLAGEFGQDNVFLDVDSVEIGEDFRDRIRKTIDAADVVLVLIGPHWECARLVEPNDFVRLELAEALSQRKLIVPVLLEGGSMPSSEELPPELASFSFRNAARLRSDPDFRSDVAKIVDALQRARGSAASVPASVPTTEELPAPAVTHATDAVRSPDPALLGPLTLRVLPPRHKHTINALAFSPDGTILATVDTVETVLWDLATLEATTAAADNIGGNVSAVAFSPDGTLLAARNKSANAVMVREVNTGAWTTRTFPILGYGASVAFSPDGTLLAASGDAIHVWDFRTGEELHHSAQVAKERIAFNPDGSGVIASNTFDGWVSLWSVERGHIRTITTTAHPVTAIKFSPDGALLAAGTTTGAIELCDPSDVSDVSDHITLLGHSALVTELAFTSDGTVLASASADHTVRLWDPVSGAAIRTITDHKSPVRIVAFSPDQMTLASAGGGVIFKGDNAVRLWTLASGAPFGN